MLRFRVPGSGFRVRVRGSGFRVRGSGFRVRGSGFRVRGSGFRVRGSGFGSIRVRGSAIRILGSGFIAALLIFSASGALGAGRSARRQADRPVRGRRARRISEIQTGSQHCQRDQRAVDQPPGTRPGLCRRRTLLPRASGPGYVWSRWGNDGGTTQPDTSPRGRRRHARPHRAQPDVVGDAANLVQLRQTPGMELHQRRDRPYRRLPPNEPTRHCRRSRDAARRSTTAAERDGSRRNTSRSRWISASTPLPRRKRPPRGPPFRA